MSVPPLKALPLDDLRRRSSTKWARYPDDILPLFVAETDFALAPEITAALQRAVADGDTGYTPPRTGVPEAFAAFAERRFGWKVDPRRIRTTCDVMMGVVEVLRGVIDPGDRVVVTPPVYPPFFEVVPEAGGVVDQVPLTRDDDGWHLDLPGIDAAFAAGARALLLCNPHNPTGTVHSREVLTELAAIAHRHGAFVISDEIHAPLTQPGVAFTSFLDTGVKAATIGFVITSASKAYNLAGLKCALMIAAADGPTQVLRELPWEVEWRTGLFGVKAAVAAFAPESDPWLDGLLAALDQNRRLLAELLAEHLPAARYRIPDAGYLAWVDVRAYGWGDDPARHILKKAAVALHHGPLFGEEGTGHVRVNFGCSPEVLTEAITRIGALVRE